METLQLTAQSSLSKGRLWTSRIMGGLVILFMLFDGIFKFIPNEEALKGTTDLGYQSHHLPVLGVLGLISVLLYAYRRTELIGAILLTGYFGGAVATHVRVDNPLFSHILFPVYLAILAWGALWLKRPKLRQLLSGTND